LKAAGHIVTATYYANDEAAFTFTRMRERGFGRIVNIILNCPKGQMRQTNKAYYRVKGQLA
jgi:hypothetical protein